MVISRRNRRGVLLLIVGIVLLSFLPRLFAGLLEKEKPTITFREAKIIESEIIYDQYQAKEKKHFRRPKSSRFQVPSTKFDPNEYSKQDWMHLGLSGKQADVVLKFTKRGIRSNDDLKKIYVLPEQLFELIKDSTIYASLPATENHPEEKNYALSTEDIRVELNSASADELMKIPGIGPYFSEKMIAYRNQLGGYVRKEQLMEIWKFDAEKYDAIRKYLELNETNRRKISVNSASVDELKAHPYISYKVANSIVKIRDQHGKYNSLESLLKSKLIDDSLLQKIKPYLIL